MRRYCLKHPFTLSAQCKTYRGVVTEAWLQPLWSKLHNYGRDGYVYVV